MMGWPPCQSCDAWPAHGYTFLCVECLKDPAKVERQMRVDFDERSKLRAETERLKTWLDDARVTLTKQTEVMGKADEHIVRLRAQNEHAKTLLARAHGLLGGHSVQLIHEIEDYLGWASESNGTDQEDK